MHRVILTLALLMSPSAARGEDRLVATIYGDGVRSCGAFLQAFEIRLPSIGVEVEGEQFSPDSSRFEQWLLGYLSGANHSQGVTGNVDLPDAQAATAWVRAWCARNPAKQVSAAAWALISEHRRQD